MTQGSTSGYPETRPPRPPSRLARLWQARSVFQRHGRSPDANRHPPTSPDRNKHLQTVSKPSRRRQFFPLFLLTSIFGGAAVGFLILRLDTSNTAASRMFISTNQFDEWLAIVCGVLGISVAVSYWTWPSFLRMARVVSRTSLISTILIYALMAALVACIPFITTGGNASFELSHFYVRITILTALLLIAGAGSFCGLILIWYKQYADIGDIQAKAGDTVRAILSTRSDIQRFFTGATVLITCGVVIIGGLRSALDAVRSIYFTTNTATISVGELILYGILFAMLLAFVLVLSYTAWKTRVASFRDHLFPIPDDGKPPKDWYEGRSDLEDLLALRLGLTGRFLAALGILAPLIGSIITIVIPTSHG
jgi:hypothetical protein